MVILMNGTVIAVNGFVRRCKPSCIERRGSWSATRGSALPSSRQPRKHSDQRSQLSALPAGSRLRSTPIALPSFSAPRCRLGAVQRASRKAVFTVRAAASPFGPMRHNPAAQRTRASGGALQRSAGARRWLPRWASYCLYHNRSSHYASRWRMSLRGHYVHRHG
jgi:hypothetical protein